MKIGLICAQFNWPGGDTAIADRFAAVVRGSETAELDSFWLVDHFWQMESYGKVEDPMLESYGGLAFAAALTSKISLGVLVTGVSYRSPGFLIKQVTTLDALSGGRAIFGIGAGWYEAEHLGLGFDFPSLAERFERLEETLQIAQQMWSGDQSPYLGQHYRLERTLNSPQAVSKPHPPILIGGSGEKKTLRMVAQYANACNFLDGADVPVKLAVLREHCDRLGRDYDAIEKTLHLRITPEETLDQVTQRCAEFAAMSIDHVIVAAPDPSTPERIEFMAELARRVHGIAVAGR